MDIDYLIVGQGLAGSLLAWELINRNCKVIIIDNGMENASKVAAGLINPITGQRFVKSTDVDYLLPYAKKYYTELASVFKQTFYIEKPLFRLFKNANEIEAAHKRLSQPDYLPYLGKLNRSADSLKDVSSPFGFIEQHQTGYLLTNYLLVSLKEFFINNQCYQQATIDYQDIQLQPTLKWKHITPKRIIFCEGYHAGSNPWFNWLPFQLAKGEILTVHHSSLRLKNILNFGNWVIPLDAQLFRVGSTFDRENLNGQPTDLGKNSLIKSLESIYHPLTEGSIVKHQANIRPCTLDKHPFIGHHPIFTQLSIFNGFGAKGSLQIPWYSQKFADTLLTEACLPSPINRHYATHFTY